MGISAKASARDVRGEVFGGVAGNERGARLNVVSVCVGGKNTEKKIKNTKAGSMEICLKLRNNTGSFNKVSLFNL